MSAKELWAEVAKKYPIHEETLRFTQSALDKGLKPWNLMTLEDSRKDLVNLVAGTTQLPFDGTIKTIHVPSTAVESGIPITVFKPASCPKVPVIFIYFHGGGMVTPAAKAYDNTVKLIASTAQAVVVSVDFRILPCPEDPLAPFNDAVTAVKWILKNKEAVGGSAESKVGVGGDTAGGQITCSVTNDIQGLDFQILVCPVTDLFCTLPSHAEFRETPGFNTGLVENLFKWSKLPIAAMADNPRVNPSARKNLETSPPTLMILAQLDPVRDWGLAYGRKLRAAKVRYEEIVLEGVAHAFFCIPEEFPVNSKKAYEHIAKFMKSIQEA